MRAQPANEVNAAVRANLDRVLRDERATTVLRIAWIRVFGGAVGTLLCVSGLWNPTVRPSLYGAAALLVIALLLLGAMRKNPALADVIAFATPCIDTPLIAFVQHQQQLRLPEAWMGVPSNVGLMMALVAVSALTLSRPAIIATAVVAVVSNQLGFEAAGVPLIPRLLAMMAPIAIAAVGITLIDRLRTMVQAARRRDLLGKYVLGNRLGAGGMAEVFEATYSPEGGFERKVAVKRILPSIAENPDAVALFRREAELGAQLAHPNIVQVLDFGSDGDSYFIAMEYVDGTAFSRLLNHLRRQHQPLPIAVVVYLAWQLAEALGYVHERASATGSPLRLVHRDLNPPNVMLSRRGEVKLGDFGIARALDQPGLTRTGMMRGKVGYSAPEQLSGQPYDARADLFSLGVTVHEALTGQRLFKGDSDLNVMASSLNAPIPRPSELRPDVPAALDALVLGLLEREVGKRTASAEVLRQQLLSLPAELTNWRAAQHAMANLVAEVREVVATPAQSPESGPGPVTDPGATEAQTRTVTHPVLPGGS